MSAKRIAILLTCMVSIASAQETVSLGVTGIQRIDIPPAGGVYMVGYNFTSSEPRYLEDVFGTNQLTSASRSRDSDKVYIWTGTSYDSYFQKSDGLFYNVLSGQEETAEVKAGMAFFLQSPPGSTLTNSIYISGAVLLDASVQREYTDAFTMIANPYPTALDLNDPSLDWSMATASNRSRDADKVYIWNPVSSSYDSFYLNGSRVWQELIPSSQNPVIPTGGGAFYEAQTPFTNAVFKTFNLD